LSPDPNGAGLGRLLESGACRLWRRWRWRRRADGAVVFEESAVSLRSSSRPIKLSLTHDGRIGQLGLKVEKKAGLPAQYGFAWEMKF